MIRFAHLSDTHFGTDVARVTDAAYAALESLRPDFLVLSGDITQRASKAQFDKARAFLERTRLPCLTVPGNHDIPLFDLVTRFTTPYSRYEATFKDREFVHIADGVALVGFDATSPWRHKHGALDTAHARTVLGDARSRIGADGRIIVVVHQPLMTAWQKDRSEEIKDGAEIALLFSELRVDAVLCGHVHVPLICTSAKLSPLLPYSFVHSGAGTALSYRRRWRKPNSFNVIEIGQDEINVTQNDYDTASAAFIAQPSHRFSRGEHGWTISGLE